MNKLHLTTASRLAMTKTATGELVPSMDTETNQQDINVAGTLISIKPAPVEYPRKDGSIGIAYQGTTQIADSKGQETTVSVLINGSAIANVVVGQTYWLTERVSKDGLYTNYSQGDLLVMSAVPATEALARRAMLLKGTPAVGTPAVVKLQGAEVSDAEMRTALIETEDFTKKAVTAMSEADVKANYDAIVV